MVMGYYGFSGMGNQEKFKFYMKQNQAFTFADPGFLSK